MAKKRSRSKKVATRLKRNVSGLERMQKAANQVDPATLSRPPSKIAPQFVLRYTPELRDKVARRAKANGLSINAELIVLLERGLSHGDAVEELQGSVGEIFDRVERLENWVREHDEPAKRSRP